MADTLRYFKKLEAAGFSRAQAEAQVEMLNDYMTNNLATRQDFAEFKFATRQDIAELRGEFAELKTDFAELRSEFTELRAELKRDIAEVRAELKHEIAELRTEVSHLGDQIIIRLGGLMVVGFGALAALLKLSAH